MIELMNFLIKELNIKILLIRNRIKMKIWQYFTSFFKRWKLLLNFSHFISISFRKSLAIFSNSSTLFTIVWSDFKADSLLLWSILVALEAFLCARLNTLTFFEVLSFAMVSCFFVSFVWTSEHVLWFLSSSSWIL